MCAKVCLASRTNRPDDVEMGSGSSLDNWHKELKFRIHSELPSEAVHPVNVRELAFPCSFVSKDTNTYSYHAGFPGPLKAAIGGF